MHLLQEHNSECKEHVKLHWNVHTHQQLLGDVSGTCLSSAVEAVLQQREKTPVWLAEVLGKGVFSMLALTYWRDCAALFAVMVPDVSWKIFVLYFAVHSRQLPRYQHFPWLRCGYKWWDFHSNARITHVSVELLFILSTKMFLVRCWGDTMKPLEVLHCCLMNNKLRHLHGCYVKVTFFPELLKGRLWRSQCE